MKTTPGNIFINRTAEEEGDRLRNEALKGSGGDRLVALEAARNLKISDIDTSTLNIDLLDLNAVVNKFEAKPNNSQ